MFLLAKRWIGIWSWLKMKTKCEVYSRVVGYIRPVEQWHNGKQQEFKDRKLDGGIKNGK